MEPIRVMLVDDEIMAIRYIKALVNWESLGFRIVAEAITASQALEMADVKDPDLIFMDIRMPAMDGLEVSKRILAQNKKRIIYLLTSYQDFGYAKEALRIGIKDYLLKHDINAQYLEEELAIIKKRLHEEKKKEQILVRQCLKDLLETGDHSAQIALELENGMFANSGIFMFYLQADKPFPVLENTILPPRLPLPVWEEHQLLKEKSRLTYLETVELAADRQVAFFFVTGMSGENVNWRLVHYTASILQESARRAHVSISIAISRLCRRPAAITGQFRQLDSLFSFFSGVSKEQIISHSTVSLPDIDVEAEWALLHRMIRDQSGDLETASLRSRIETVFTHIENGKFHPVLFKRTCYAIVLLLEQLRASKDMPSYSDLIDRGEVDTGLWHSVTDIRKWFLQETETVASLSGAMSYSNKVRKIIMYIHNHYNEDLTVETIARELVLSGDHIRHLFKEEVGRTVTDFVIRYRVEKAKILLRQDDYKIYEIAELVGYRSSQYFSNVFKKWTGKTPQEYKEEVW